MSQINRFDHVIIAARDLDAAIALFRQRLGLDARFGGRHTGRGTHNALVRFGLDYLEILSVVDVDELRAAPAKRMRLHDFLAQHRGGLLAYCLATDDIEGLAERFRKHGLGALGPFDMERTRPDGQVLKWRLLIPGGTAYRQPWPFFIQWQMSDEERLVHDRPGIHELDINCVTGICVTVANMEHARHLYGRQLGLTQLAEDSVPALAATRVRYGVGDFTIDLLAPSGPGAIKSELEASGEGPYAVMLGASNLPMAAQALEEKGLSLHAPAGYEGFISPDREVLMGSRLWFETIG